MIGCGSHDQLALQPRDESAGSAGDAPTGSSESQTTGGQREGSDRASGGKTPGQSETGGVAAVDTAGAGGTFSLGPSSGRAGRAGAAGDSSGVPEVGDSGTAGDEGGAFDAAGSGAADGHGGALETGRSGAAGSSDVALHSGGAGAAGAPGVASEGGHAGSAPSDAGGAGPAGAGGIGAGAECTADTCGAHGTCAASGGGSPCQCETGYDGDFCEECAEGYELNTITHGCELPCPGPRQIRCDGQCVDGTTERTCGGCDNDCGDALCRPSHGGWACTCPYAICGGVCSNPLTDESNCTNCGAVCSAGTRCFQGVCRVPAADPPDDGSCVGEGEFWCGDGVCLESPRDGYDEDEANCGGCGIECRPEEICVAGKCQPASENCWWPCDPLRGELCCGHGACVDYLSDPHNCGSCGMQCDAGEACVGGHCQCAGPTARCGDECFDLGFDNDHCGACGHECSVIAGERCVYGECLQGGTGCGLSCGSSELCCPAGNDAGDASTECVDISSMASSGEHCGGCEPCPSEQPCSDGVCGCSWPNASCPDPADPDTTQCVSLETAENCGECGLECTGGRECAAPDASEPDERCGCPTALTWCQGSASCVDLGRDEHHCGRCGNVCGAGEKCIGHRCVEQTGECPGGCAEDQACCLTEEGGSSACLDILEDANHCGGCATVCDATYTCSGGLCQAAGDLCSAPAILPPAGTYINGSLSPFADDGAYTTACGANEGETEQGVEVFYVLEAPPEGATYDVWFFSEDEGVGVSMGTSESASSVCGAVHDTCLSWDPITPVLSGPVVFMVYGPASGTFELGVYPW